MSVLGDLHLLSSVPNRTRRVTRPASEAGLDPLVEANVFRLCLVAGATFLAFAAMHVSPLGSGLPSQIGGNVVPGLLLLGFAVHLRRRATPLARPNAALAGVFMLILSADAFLTYADHSAVSINVGLFVMMLAGALLFSRPALLVTLGAAAAEGAFVTSLVPGGHLASQLALEGAAATIALIMHSTRLSTQRRLGALLAAEEERRAQLEESVRAVGASKERFRRLADAAFEGLAIHEHGTLLECNAACESMFGYETGTLAGRTAFDIIHESCHPLIHARIATPIDDPYEAIGVRRDGSTFPIEIAGKSIPYQGRMHRVVALRDLSERQRVQEAEREQTVARRIVRRALVSEARPSAELLAERRALGRSIACETQAESIEKGLHTFRAMGLGDLWLVGQEGNRWVFEGNDMLDRTPGARMPSCSLAVGYIEGLLASLTHEEMRGAELACESQGHAACRFVALAKGPQAKVERGAGDRLAMGRVGSRSVASPISTRPGSVSPPSGPP